MMSRASGAASAATSTAAHDAQGVVQEAAEQSRAVAGEARAQVQQLMSETRGELQQQADQRTQQAAERLRTMSTSIDALVDGRPDEAADLTRYLRQAQSRIDDMAGRLEARGPQGVLDDVSAFARRRPGTFLLAAAAAGFGVARLARAGSAARHEQSDRRDGSQALPMASASAAP
jgi:hypothetical protein